MTQAIGRATRHRSPDHVEISSLQRPHISSRLVAPGSDCLKLEHLPTLSTSSLLGASVPPSFPAAAAAPGRDEGIFASKKLWEMKSY